MNETTQPIKPITLEELHAEHVRSVTNIVELIQSEAKTTRGQVVRLHSDIMAQYANEQRALTRLRKTVDVRTIALAVSVAVLAVVACVGG